MKIHKTLFILGLLILITPFSGLPSEYEDILVVIFGSILIIMSISIKLKKVYKQHLIEKNHNANFVESIPEKTADELDNIINSQEPEILKQAEIFNESGKKE